jgi:hypothetical protein
MERQVHDVVRVHARAAAIGNRSTGARRAPVFDSEENYLSAGHLSYCGQTEAAASMLRRAIEGNYCSYPAMESDSLFTGVRAHPQYPDIRAAGRECQQRFLAARALQQG